MDMGRHRPHEQGDALMQGIIQTIDAKRGFGFLQGTPRAPRSFSIAVR
jgi:hypothetical protein